ncbi:MAG TPA: hypothetical protein VKT32_11750 [Chthonomonadaceae bacterium]|nr:hypothetical protein [Chthonomonadaceae bacterium]
MKMIRFLIFLFALIGLSGTVGAQTSFPMLTSTYPTGVPRGKTTEVTIQSGGGGGGNLYGAYNVVFEGEGVKAEIVPPEKGWPAKDPKKPWDVPGVDSVKMRVTVSPDAPLGAREYRVATPRFGISTVGLLVIGDLPEVMEQEPNNDIAHANPVSLPCVVNGRFQDGEDIDCFKFKAAAGQEVVFTVECARLEDKIHDLQDHADPLLTLKDLNGKELAQNDDYYRADPMLPYKFEKAGEYVISIRDVGYRGNANWVYRLTMTTRPYVTAVVPCAVRPGQSVMLHVEGVNLGGKDTVRLDVPANTPPGIREMPLTFPNGLSNPVPLLISNAPQAVVAPAAGGSKTVPAALTGGAPPAVKGALALPGGVNSWLAIAGQPDRYRFHAKQGEAWGFEVTARRLYSAMDSELKVRDAKGNVLAENDDTFGKDSRIEWTAPATGDYTLEIRDLTGHAGPDYFYNLTAQRLLPDFSLRCDTDRAMIAPGNRTALFVLLDRKNGFAGDVKVEVTGLPAGVTATPLTLPPAMSQGEVLLSAAPDAKIAMSPIQVTGTAQLPGPDGKLAPAIRIAQPLTEIYLPGGGRGLLGVDTQGVAVTEPNDIEVTVNTQQVTLTPGGTAKIEVSIKRRPDYNKPVTLDVVLQHLGGVFANPLPPGVSIDDGASKTLLNEKENAGAIVLKAAPDAAAIKDWPIAVLGNVSINFVMKVWYASPPISLTVTPPAKK